MSPVTPIDLPCHGPSLWVGAHVRTLKRGQRSLFDDYDYAGFQGIYLHAVRLASGLYRVHYVGLACGSAARTFRVRMREHLGGYRLWTSRIYKSDAFARGERRFLFLRDVYYCGRCAKNPQKFLRRCPDLTPPLELPLAPFINPREFCDVCRQAYARNRHAHLALELTQPLKDLMEPHRLAMLQTYQVFVIPIKAETPEILQECCDRLEGALWQDLEKVGGDVEAFLDETDDHLTLSDEERTQPVTIHFPDEVRLEGLAHDPVSGIYCTTI